MSTGTKVVIGLYVLVALAYGLLFWHGNQPEEQAKRVAYQKIVDDCVSTGGAWITPKGSGSLCVKIHTPHAPAK